MLALLRVALQLVLFFLLLSAVIGVVSAETGSVEKIVLVVLAAVLLWLAPRVRRLGNRSTARAT